MGAGRHGHGLLHPILSASLFLILCTKTPQLLQRVEDIKITLKPLKELVWGGIFFPLIHSLFFPHHEMMGLIHTEMPSPLNQLKRTVISQEDRISSASEKIKHVYRN